jgi:hypothetical protein
MGKGNSVLASIKNTCPERPDGALGSPCLQVNATQRSFPRNKVTGFEAQRLIHNSTKAPTYIFMV